MERVTSATSSSQRLLTSGSVTLPPLAAGSAARQLTTKVCRPTKPSLLLATTRDQPPLESRLQSAPESVTPLGRSPARGRVIDFSCVSNRQDTAMEYSAAPSAVTLQLINSASIPAADVPAARARQSRKDSSSRFTTPPPFVPS